MEPYWDLIERIVKEADLVLEILDARLISLSRNDRVEELIKEHDKPVIFVINKSDLIFKKMLKKQMVDFREEIKGYKGEVVFFSSRNNISQELRTGGNGYFDVLDVAEDIWGKELKHRAEKGP